PAENYTLSLHAALPISMADIPPPPPGSTPGPSFSDIPPASQVPPGAPGYTPPPGYPNSRPGVSIMSQFSGPAATSVLIGVLSVGVPIVTSFVSNSGTFYFYVLPIFGFISGVRAVSRGLVLGGII